MKEFFIPSQNCYPTGGQLMDVYRQEGLCPYYSPAAMEKSQSALSSILKKNYYMYLHRNGRIFLGFRFRHGYSIIDAIHT